MLKGPDEKHQEHLDAHKKIQSILNPNWEIDNL